MSFKCDCFFTENYFIDELKLHISLKSRIEIPDEAAEKTDFINYLTTVLPEVDDLSNERLGNIEKKIKEEIKRRKYIGEDCLDRRLIISQKYKPKHRQVYCFKEYFLDDEFLALLSQKKNFDESHFSKYRESGERSYSLKVFTPKFCDLLLEELDHFQCAKLPRTKPNTMNNYGIMIEDLLEMDDGLIKPLREKYLRPICSILFPDWGGDQLDSHKAFTVKYETSGDRDLHYHFDNAEVTINISLSRQSQYSGGQLYFGPMNGEPAHSLSGSGPRQFTTYDHKQGVGLLHRGQHMHGAYPIEQGVRQNLIIWMRSSKVRNLKCPMCQNVPRLVPVVALGDGFTKDDAAT